MSSDNQISVIVKLFADLRKYGPEKASIKLSNGSTINTILDNYDIPKEKTKMIILLNAKPIYDKQYILRDGDTVALFPPLAGG